MPSASAARVTDGGYTAGEEELQRHVVRQRSEVAVHVDQAGQYPLAGYVAQLGSGRDGHVPSRAGSGDPAVADEDDLARVLLACDDVHDGAAGQGYGVHATGPLSREPGIGTGRRFLQ
jgi:hypothetical protein